MKKQTLSLIALIVAIVALGIALYAVMAAQKAQQWAVSELVVEEHNSLHTPIYDEERSAYGFVTIYDISISNVSGPLVTLKKVAKAESGSGFLAFLRGEEVVHLDVETKAFISKWSSSQIQADPKKLKELTTEDMGDAQVLDLTLNPGETKIIHVGVALEPYDEQNQPLANMVLTSFELQFDNGKSYTFRRGFPIYPLQQ